MHSEIEESECLGKMKVLELESFKENDQEQEKVLGLGKPALHAEAMKSWK